MAESTLPNETLRYSVNWPSGLSLGEATLSASSSESRQRAARSSMHFQFDLDASVPGFAVSDRFRSAASGSFCSAEFQKTTSHGSKKVDDKETFDPNTGTVTRGSGDGSSEILANTCGKDALAFLYFLRQELSQGRVPPHQTVFFGAPYEIKLDSGGHGEREDREQAGGYGSCEGVRERSFLQHQIRSVFSEGPGAHAGAGARSPGDGHVFDGTGEIALPTYSWPSK